MRSLEYDDDTRGSTDSHQLGNLPLAELEYQVSWEETPENVIWVGEHFHKKPYGEGESVRREVHIYIKRGISMTAEQNEVQNG